MTSIPDTTTWGDPTVIAAVGSALAAWVAALFAYWSYRVSRSQLRLLEQAEFRQRANLVPYLADGFFTSLKSESARLYAFSISATNRSDAPNSIVRVELEFEAHAADSPPQVLRVQHDATLNKHLTAQSPSVLEVPCSIGARNTVAGWLLFSVPVELITMLSYDNALLAFVDAHDKRSSLDVLTVKELINGREVEETGIQPATQYAS